MSPSRVPPKNSKEESLKDRLYYAYWLANRLAYTPANEARYTATLFGREVSEEIWLHANGMYMAMVQSRIDGRCSLSAALSFNMPEEEKALDETIQLFQYFLKQIGDSAMIMRNTLTVKEQEKWIRMHGNTAEAKILANFAESMDSTPDDAAKILEKIAATPAGKKLLDDINQGR